MGWNCKLGVICLGNCFAPDYFQQTFFPHLKIADGRGCSQGQNHDANKVLQKPYHHQMFASIPPPRQKLSIAAFRIILQSHLPKVEKGLNNLGTISSRHLHICTIFD